jgi:hypothetical protein
LLQVIVVLATANHFLLDVVGGAACILLGYGIVTLVGRALGKTGEPSPVAEAAAVEQSVPTLAARAPLVPAQVQRRLADDDSAPVSPAPV